MYFCTVEKSLALLLVLLAKGETPLVHCYSHIFNLQSINTVNMPAAYDSGKPDGLELPLQQFLGEILDTGRCSSEQTVVNRLMKEP